MRAEMPGVAAWIDELRRVFGRDEIDAQIRRGMRGEPTFYAYENGHAIGTPIPKPDPPPARPVGRRRVVAAHESGGGEGDAT